MKKHHMANIGYKLLELIYVRNNLRLMCKNQRWVFHNHSMATNKQEIIRAVTTTVQISYVNGSKEKNRKARWEEVEAWLNEFHQRGLVVEHQIDKRKKVLLLTEKGETHVNGGFEAFISKGLAEFNFDVMQ